MFVTKFHMVNITLTHGNHFNILTFITGLGHAHLQSETTCSMLAILAQVPTLMLQQFTDRIEPRLSSPTSHDYSLIIISSTIVITITIIIIFNALCILLLLLSSVYVFM